MTLGKSTHRVIGILTLLFAAGSASALSTFPVCLHDMNSFAGMTDSPVFDPVLVGSQSSVTQSPAQGTGLVAAPQGDTDMIALGGLTPLPALAGEAPLGNTREDHGITCQIPSPGTLLLGALGAFLVGALRMRRML